MCVSRKIRHVRPWIQRVGAIGAVASGSSDVLGESLAATHLPPRPYRRVAPTTMAPTAVVEPTGMEAKARAEIE